MKNIIKMYLFILLFFYKFFLLAEYHIDKKIFNIISGVYKEESWFDGKKLFRYPVVSGRWTFYEGQEKGNDI